MSGATPRMRWDVVRTWIFSSNIIDDALSKVNHMSMAHSLEVRAPLLDHRILELAARLPTALKMNRPEGKLPLRKFAASRMPAEVHNLPKRGFSIPAAPWLRGVMRPRVEDAHSANSTLAVEVRRAERFRTLWREHWRGARDHSVFLRDILMLGLWEHSTSLSGRETTDSRAWYQAV